MSESAAIAQSNTPSGRRVWLRRPAVWIPASLIVIAGLVAAGMLLQVRAELTEARRHMGFGDFEEARACIDSFLKWFPASTEAHMLAAEVAIKDESLHSDAALSAALGHLRKIPDSDQLASRARIQEARIYLFLMDMPGRAEERLQKAIQLDSSTAEPYYLMWKLMDLTGRSFYAEEFFIQTYLFSPTELKPVRLREWYMSQFYPATANPTLDRLMQVTSGYQPSGAVSELRRFERFVAAEPTNPANSAIIARWYLLDGSPRDSLKFLKDAMPETVEPLQDSTFISTLINTLYDLGEFQQAWQFYEQWAPEDSYEYHRWTAILEDDVRENRTAALAAYDRALSKWPGPADWRMMFRKANCLVQLGRTDEGNQIRKKAQQVEAMMEEDIHRPLRNALAAPDDPDTIQSMIDLYDQLEMQLESGFWRSELSRVATNN